MAKSRASKFTTIEKLTQGFKDAKSVAFADYQGITVAQADELRKQMRAANVRYVVSKKTLVNRAAKDAGIELDAKQFKGMLGVAFGIEDEIAPAKILGDLSKKTTIKLVGGVFEGAVVSQERMITLSKLPSKHELLGIVVGTIYAPVSAFVRLLNAIREQREAGTPVKAEAPSAPVAEAPTATAEETPVAEASVTPPVAEAPAAA